MQKLNKNNFYLINFFFLLFPISFIFGNFAININVILLFLSTLIIFLTKKESIKFKINFIDKLIIIFFLYTLIVLILNYFTKIIQNLTLQDFIITKTIFFQRYLVIYFLIRILIEKKILNIDLFNKICGSCAFFVCIDIFFQFIFGKDLFGIEPHSSRHYSGVFGEELIAGGYLQRFGFFILFFWSTLNKNSIFKKTYIFILLNLLTIIGIFLSGNRMPLILFIFGLIIYSYFDLTLKKFLIKIFIIFILVFSVLFHSNKSIKMHFSNFLIDGLNLIEVSFFKDISKQPRQILERPYIIEFHCSKIFIKENLIFGGGIRSYRTHPGGCLTHSHNYYLETLVDLGLIGFGILITILFFLYKKIILYFKIHKNLPLIIMPYLVILIIEFFPIRTSGSIFSTGNATIIFTFLAILISLISLKNPKKIKLF